MKGSPPKQDVPQGLFQAGFLSPVRLDRLARWCPVHGEERDVQAVQGIALGAVPVCQLRSRDPISGLLQDGPRCDLTLTRTQLGRGGDGRGGGRGGYWIHYEDDSYVWEMESSSVPDPPASPPEEEKEEPPPEEPEQSPDGQSIEFVVDDYDGFNV